MQEWVEEAKDVPQINWCGSDVPARRFWPERSDSIDVLFGILEAGTGMAWGCSEWSEVVEGMAKVLSVELASGHVHQSWSRGSDVVLHVKMRIKVPPGLADTAIAQVRKRMAVLRHATSMHGGVRTEVPYCGVVGFGRSVNAIWGAFASLHFDNGRRRSIWEREAELSRRKRQEEERARELLGAAYVGLERLFRAARCVQQAWRFRLAMKEKKINVLSVGAASATMRVSDAACADVAVTRDTRLRGCGKRGGRRHRRGSDSAATVVVVEKSARGGGRQRRRRRTICARWAALAGGTRRA